MLILTRIRKGYRRNESVLPHNVPTSRFDDSWEKEALWTLHKFSVCRPQTVGAPRLKRTNLHIVIGGTRHSVPSPFDIPSPEPHLLTLLSFDTGFEKRRIYARKCKEIQKLAVLRRFCLTEHRPNVLKRETCGPATLLFTGAQTECVETRNLRSCDAFVYRSVKSSIPKRLKKRQTSHLLHAKNRLITFTVDLPAGCGNGLQKLRIMRDEDNRARKGDKRPLERFD